MTTQRDIADALPKLPSALGDIEALKNGGGMNLGALAQKDKVNNGDWSGADLSVANGGTGASSADAARDNLGVKIGRDVQAWDAGLDALAGATATGIYQLSSTDTWTKVTLGTGLALSNGTLSVTGMGNGDMLKADNLSGLANNDTALANLGGGTGAGGGRAVFKAADAGAIKMLLSLTIGTDIQAYDADLAAIAQLTTTSFGRDYLTVPDAASARTKAGLGTAAVLNTGTTSGTIPLIGSNGKLAAALMPAVAITDTFVVGSQADQVALTAERGDVAIRTDLNKSFILRTDDPTVFANWQELLAPSGGGGSSGTVTSVSVVTANGVSGSVANASTTPAITLTLGAITPSSVAATGNVTGANLSGTNTGDQTSVTGNAGTATKWQTARALSYTGDVTGSASVDGSADKATALTLTDNAVTNAKLAQVATARFKGRTSSGTGNVEDLTGTQATALLDTVSTTARGLVPVLPNDATKYLNGAGQFTTPSGGGSSLRKQSFVISDPLGYALTGLYAAIGAETVVITAILGNLQYSKSTNANPGIFGATTSVASGSTSAAISLQDKAILRIDYVSGAVNGVAVANVSQQ